MVVCVCLLVICECFLVVCGGLWWFAVVAVSVTSRFQQNGLHERCFMRNNHMKCMRVDESCIVSLLCYISEKSLKNYWAHYCWCLNLNVYSSRMHVRDRVAEKEFDIAIQMTLEGVSSKIQENRNGRKK